ncbi:hypothetical protein J6590_016043 [Homalodisca vitripennis]|nr:hypothetical protein J6590_016043 [Homalodisca vitripennis]
MEYNFPCFIKLPTYPNIQRCGSNKSTYLAVLIDLHGDRHMRAVSHDHGEGAHSRTCTQQRLLVLCPTVIDRDNNTNGSCLGLRVNTEHWTVLETTSSSGLPVAMVTGAVAGGACVRGTVDIVTLRLTAQPGSAPEI